MASKGKCPHGQPLSHNLTGHPHRKELEDPGDYDIMEFYTACDCCDCPMHNNSPFPGNGIMQKDGSILCALCDEGERQTPA